MKQETVKLKNGTFVTGDAFDDKDLLKLKSIFKDWQKISKKVNKLGGRNLNIPEIISEGLCCIYFNSIRTNNTKNVGSSDCIQRKTCKRIQIKSTSILKDCTSFGPKSTWDLLYFFDFAPKGSVTGKVYIYKIPNSFKNLILNKSKKETFKKQQSDERRPRFSIKERIIAPQKLKPIKKISLI